MSAAPTAHAAAALTATAAAAAAVITPTTTAEAKKESSLQGPSSAASPSPEAAGRPADPRATRETSPEGQAREAAHAAETARRAARLAAEYRSPDAEDWIPEARHFQRDWRTGRAESPWQDLPLPQADSGVTALAGQVLTLNGNPLAGVTLRLGDHVARSDEAGHFLLETLSAGADKLTIDGRSASVPGSTYGVFEARVDIADGFTNTLPFTVWMPRLDMAHTVKIPSPTTREVVVTSPLIPGLEVRIPAGVTIRDINGNPVTELGITPIPIDRSPFPLPRFGEIPVFFTVQPGGARLDPLGARIVYPNYPNQPPGTRNNFWHYDPDDRGWYVYGQATVTDDRRQVVPDPGVSIYEFTGAMFNGTGLTPPSWWAAVGNVLNRDGDPVDLSSGLFVYDKTDLVLPDVLPVALTRTYRQGDTASRPFGIGATHPYEMFLWSAQQYQQVDLILPDGGRVHYVRISAGTSWGDAVFEHTATQGAFYKSRIRYVGAEYQYGSTWELALADGTVYVFGDNAPLQSVRDRYGNTTTIKRTGTNGYGNQIGNITQIRSSSGRWLEFTYDAGNRITQATDNAGRAVSYVYDASGRLWKATDAAGGVTEYAYDAAHRMTSIKDARGITFLTNEYDSSSGRVTRQTQADGTTYQFAYALDGSGRITRTDVTDPLGTVRRVTFNVAGYTLTDTAAYGTAEQQTTTLERDPTTGFVTATVDPTGRRATYAYDAMGNVTSTVDLAGTAETVTSTQTYDSRFQQVATSTDPLSRTTTFAYDDKGNLISVTDPLNNRTTYTHSATGQPLSTTDPLNNRTEFTYSLGDLVAVRDPLGNVTRRFVDSAGRVSRTTDPLGNRTRTEYDALNRVTRATDALGSTTEFTYDANGNRLTVKDARANTTSYAYDAMDRPQTRTDPLLGAEQFQYDAGGRLVRATDRKGQVTTLRYDRLGRQIFTGFGTTGTEPNQAYESTVALTYDAANRLTQAVDSAAGTITRAYDNFDRLTSETTPQGTVTYAYDTVGRRTAMTVAGQPQVTYAYDAGDRPTQIAQGSSAVAFVHDAAGRRTRLTLPNGISIESGFDAGSRLTGLTYKQGTTVLGDLTYGYDARGARVQVGGSYARTAMPQAQPAATYDAANRLTARGAASFTYDANGSLTGDGASSYAWNARGQLASLSGGGTTASFRYDPFGRRAGKTVNGASTDYLYDADDIVQELTGTTVTANVLGGLGVDEVFQRTDGAGARGFLTDALGSTIALADGAGALQTQYTYDPFGGTTASGAASSSASQFTGRENDGTGLYYYRARFYAPSLGRFISEDPIGFGGGDTNLYAYAANDPTNLTDPSGNFAVAPLAAACAWGAAMDVAVYAGSNYVTGRKGTLGGGLQAAGTGCVSGVAGLGFGKALSWVAPKVIPQVARLLADETGSLIVSPKGVAVAEKIAQKWNQGNFSNVVDSMAYHLNKHGNGRTITQYTDDAVAFFQKNRAHAQWGTWNPKWQPSYRLKIGNQGGYFTRDGKVLTYWD